MAKNIKDDAEGAQGTTKAHNVEAINKTLSDGMEEMLRLEREIAEKKEAHVAPLQEALKKKKRQMKADTNVSIQAINAHFKVFKLYRSAEEMTEEDDGDKLRDDLRIVYDAMLAGGQLSWVDVIEQQAAAE